MKYTTCTINTIDSRLYCLYLLLILQFFFFKMYLHITRFRYNILISEKESATIRDRSTHEHIEYNTFKTDTTDNTSFFKITQIQVSTCCYSLPLRVKKLLWIFQVVLGEMTRDKKVIYIFHRSCFVKIYIPYREYNIP